MAKGNSSADNNWCGLQLKAAFHLPMKFPRRGFCVLKGTSVYRDR